MILSSEEPIEEFSKNSGIGLDPYLAFYIFLPLFLIAITVVLGIVNK